MCWTHLKSSVHSVKLTHSVLGVIKDTWYNINQDSICKFVIYQVWESNQIGPQINQIPTQNVYLNLICLLNLSDKDCMFQNDTGVQTAIWIWPH